MYNLSQRTSFLHTHNLGSAQVEIMRVEAWDSEKLR